MAGNDDSMAGLHQIEADIQLCERFLNLDARDSQELASVSSAPSKAAPPARDAPARASNMSQQRRKEILDRLLAERKAGKKLSAAGSAGQSPAKPRGVPKYAVSESDQGWGRAAGGGGLGGETREELIQRLIAEKRARESRVHNSQGSGDTVTAASAMQARMDQRTARQAWGDVPRSHDRNSPDTDSLDGAALHSGKGNGRSVQRSSDTVGEASQRRARPASAPRQRMTREGGIVAGQDSTESEGSSIREPGARRMPARPQSSRGGRSGSVPKERPLGDASKLTRPKSPNLSKTPNMHSRERITRELENEMREQLTFKPKVSEYQFSDGAPHHGRSRVEYLAQSKKAAWEARERAKLQREEDEQRRACTFKPKVIPKSGASPSKVPVEVRLLNTASNKQALRQRAKRHLEEQELIKMCNGNTFRPKINEASRLLDKSARPLHERVGQVQRAGV